MPLKIASRVLSEQGLTKTSGTREEIVRSISFDELKGKLGLIDINVMLGTYLLNALNANR